MQRELTIWICDDERSFAEELGAEILAWFRGRGAEPGIRVFLTAEEAAREASRVEETVERPALIFMDIALGDKDGIALTARLRGRLPHVPVIFLTGMEQRAPDGYEVGAFAFLYKRTYRRKLAGTLERFERECLDEGSVAVRGADGIRLIPLSEVYYVQAQGRKSAVVTAAGEHLDNDAIGQFAERLPAWLFVCCYHALYVNLDHIARVGKDIIELDDGRTLPVSRRNRGDVLAALMGRFSK